MTEILRNMEIIRSKRKTISVEIKRDLRIIVRAPMRMKKRDIELFICDKAEWIQKKVGLVRQQNEQKGSVLTDEEVIALASEAKRYIAERIAYYAVKMGVTVGRITIRNQRSRWGSCSAKGNLNFNCLLMLCPPEVRDYVVVHELCHRIELNHSPRFWANVESVMPQYAESKRWLKENGSAIIGRLG